MQGREYSSFPLPLCASCCHGKPVFFTEQSTQHAKTPQTLCNIEKQSVKWQKLLQMSNNITEMSKIYLSNIFRELKKKKKGQN